MKSIFLVAGGTGFAQVLNILLSPVITRIYGPEEYGILTLYTAILGLLTIIGSLRYESAIPIADDDQKAINILVLSILALIVFVSIILFIILLVGYNILSLFNAEELYNYRWLIPVGVFLVGLYNIFSKWAFRERNYYAISKTKINQSLASNSTKIMFGLLNFGPTGLLFGQVIGSSAGVVTLGRPVLKKGFLFNHITIKNIRWAAKRYVRFPLYSAPSSLFNVAGLQLPILFLTSLFGPSVIGLYGLAMSIVNLPMKLIGDSVGDVFFGEAANIGKSNPKRIKKLSHKIILKLFLIGLVPLLTLIFFGPLLFSFVFGDNWYVAGEYARLISFLVFFRLIFTPISKVFAVFERLKTALFLDIFRVLLVTLSFILSMLLSMNAYWTIGLYSLAMSIIYILTFILAQRILNVEIDKISNNI